MRTSHVESCICTQCRSRPTEKQLGLALHRLSWHERERLGIPKVQRGRVDETGVLIHGVLSRRSQEDVSALLDATEAEDDEETVRLLAEFGVLDEIEKSLTTVAATA